MSSKHRTLRSSHPLVGREVQVIRIEQLTPGVRRIHFASPELDGFHSPEPDDHVAIFFSSADGEEHKRHYTPRQFDAEKRQLAIDFAMHEAGPAAEWAANAQTGDFLEIGGPRSSLAVADDFDWYLLIGDETAIPAIARRVEALRPGVPVQTVIAIADAAEAQTFGSRAEWKASWVMRGRPSREDGARLLAAIEELGTLGGDGFIWIGGEAAIAQALREHFLGRGHPRQWLHASAYWKRGTPNVHEVLGED